MSHSWTHSGYLAVLLCRPISSKLIVWKTLPWATRLSPAMVWRPITAKNRQEAEDLWSLVSCQWLRYRKELPFNPYERYKFRKEIPQPVASGEWILQRKHQAFSGVKELHWATGYFYSLKHELRINTAVATEDQLWGSFGELLLFMCRFCGSVSSFQIYWSVNMSLVCKTFTFNRSSGNHIDFSVSTNDF